MFTCQNPNYFGLNIRENSIHLFLQFFLEIPHLPLQNSLYLSKFLSHIFCGSIQTQSKPFELKLHEIWKSHSWVPIGCCSIFQMARVKVTTQVHQQRMSPLPTSSRRGGGSWRLWGGVLGHFPDGCGGGTGSIHFWEWGWPSLAHHWLEGPHKNS